MRWLLIVLLLLTSHCTIVGAGIGAAIPKYADAPDGVVSGTDARLLDDHDVVIARGTVEHGAHGQDVLLAGGNEVALDEARVKRVQRKIGSHWELGTAIGAMVDVIALVTAIGVLAATNTHININGGASHLFNYGGLGGLAGD